ncbi:MAG: DUF2279 domain-containing protein [Bacteroidetes bacterium]|nr:DUF2279 domain-containing protein [Bacteroidota bacterium]
MHLLRVKFFILLLLSVNQLAFASDSLSVFKKRKLALGISSLALTSGSLIYLNQAWYQEYNTSTFHTFNDNDEWFQMDKCGHTFTTYQTGRLMMNAMEWAGYSKKYQLIIGGLSGLAYMSAIEVMDGYSAGWGFSWGDMSVNALGSGLAIGQKLLWNEQRIQLKFSFYSSEYAKYRPDLLGKSFATQILKDYNGQIYWLSINPSSFMKKETKFPKWLNVAFGYGANGMLGAKYNNIVIEDEDGNVKNFNRYRQGYVSLDVDLTRIKTKSKVLKSVFSCLNMIKIPFPNLELSEGKLKFNYY